MIHPQAKGNRFYYGWIIVGVALFASLVISGSRMAFGPSFKFMQEDFASNRGLLSIAMSLNQLFYGFASPLVGWLTDRYGAKTVVIVSAVITFAGLLGSSFAPNLWTLYLAYGVFAGFGFSGATVIPFSALVTRWFRRKSGLALGVFTTGTPVGQMIFAPFSMFLILGYGWRAAYVVLGAIIALVIIPLAWGLIRTDPKVMGLLPDGDTHPPEAGSPGPQATGQGLTASKSLAEAIRTKPYWLLCAGWFTCGFSGFLVATHLVPFALDLGMDPMQAATVLSLLGAFSVAGTLGIGAISDRIGCKNPLAAIYFSRFLAFPLLLTPLAASNFGFIYVFAMVMGFGQLATLPLASLLTRKIWGQQSMGVILGTILLSHQIGAAIGVYLGGAIFDVTGNYNLVFAMASGLSLLAGAASHLIREDRNPAPAPVMVPAE